jgi:hypothetical protein
LPDSRQGFFANRRRKWTKSSTLKTFSPNARGRIECIFLAASELTEEGRNPFHTVANIASKKIDEAIALLNEYRESGEASPIPAAPDAKPKSPAARTKRGGQ